MRRRRRGTPEWLPPEDDDGYRGPAVLAVDGCHLDVYVHLSGHLEPLDGRFHWYGRLQRDDAVAAAKDDGAVLATIRIGDGPPREVRLAEYDPWGNIALRGEGAPPYPRRPVEVEVPAVPWVPMAQGVSSRR